MVLKRRIADIFIENRYLLSPDSVVAYHPALSNEFMTAYSKAGTRDSLEREFDSRSGRN